MNEETDNAILLRLQETFLKTKNPNDLEELYIVLIDLSGKLVNKITHTYKFYISEIDKDNIVEDTATEIIEKLITERLIVNTSFTGYLYKVVLNKTFKYKNITEDIEQYHISDSNKLQNDMIQDMEEEEVVSFVWNIVYNYLYSKPFKTQLTILKHFQVILGTNKHYRKQLYKLKTKADKDLFHDIMCELKEQLKGRINAKERTDTKVIFY